MRRSFRRTAAVASALLLLAASPAEPAPADIPADVVPTTIGGLTAAPEDITPLVKKHVGPKSYLRSTRLWSLRDGPRLRATLQVGKLVADAEPESRAFQRQVVGRIGQTGARRRVVGDTSLWVTVSNEQALYIWFRPEHVLILSVAGDFPKPRRLLREALAVRP